QVISVGRVMTCVLGMVVRREREIRDFVKTPFYRLMVRYELSGGTLEGEWKVSPTSMYFQSPALYKENGLKKKEDAEKLQEALSQNQPVTALVRRWREKRRRKILPFSITWRNCRTMVPVF